MNLEFLNVLVLSISAFRNFTTAGGFRCGAHDVNEVQPPERLVNNTLGNCFQKKKKKQKSMLVLFWLAMCSSPISKQPSNPDKFRGIHHHPHPNWVGMMMYKMES